MQDFVQQVEKLKQRKLDDLKEEYSAKYAKDRQRLQNQVKRLQQELKQKLAANKKAKEQLKHFLQNQYITEQSLEYQYRLVRSFYQDQVDDWKKDKKTIMDFYRRQLAELVDNSGDLILNRDLETIAAEFKEAKWNIEIDPTLQSGFRFISDEIEFDVSFEKWCKDFYEDCKVELRRILFTEPKS